MCRILIYRCPAVIKEIVTQGTETLITCKNPDCSSKNDIKGEFDSEILISHTDFPEFHKLIFVEALKEEELEAKIEINPEVAENYEEHLEAIESADIKDESSSIGLFKDSVTDKLDDSKRNEKSEEMVAIEDLIPKRWSRTLGPPPYKCPKCERVLKTRSSYKSHVRMHQRKYSCEVCSKGFNDGEKLKKHLLKHTGEKIYQCSHCTKSYSQLHKLKEHVVTHIKDRPRPFGCDKCPKAFSSKCGLKSHSLCHTTARPYVCEFCGMAFGRTISLKDHLRTHSDEKPFKCDQCTKSFRTKGILRHHLRTHTDVKAYVCDICGKALKGKSSLNLHKKGHRLDREMFQCSMCDKQYTSKGQRNRHIMTHLDIKNYKCDYCDSAFVRKEHAVRHMALHSKYGDHKFVRSSREKPSGRQTTSQLSTK